jgi:hypothetical protein
VKKAYQCSYCQDTPPFEPADEKPQFLLCRGGCNINYYCDRSCQKDDWPDHKAQCKDPEWRAANKKYGDAKAKEATRRREERDKVQNAIVEITGETCFASNQRVALQEAHDATWDAFERRVKKRKGKPIEYRHPVFGDDQVLRFDNSNVDIGQIAPGILQIKFAPELSLAKLAVCPCELVTLLTHGSSRVDMLTKADRDLRLGGRAFIAGDMNPAHALQITDAGVKSLCQAFPNLEVMRLYSTKELAGRAFPEIHLNCANIEAVTITATRQNKTANLDDPEILQDLVDKEYRAKLRYLEFRGVRYKNNR